MQLPTVSPQAAEWYATVPRDVSRHVVFGITLLIVTFGGFGLWAATAPLAAAVITQGSFVATGRNRIVQHLEGGIIKEILVSEGDSVAAGQPILLLDETAALATERELFLRQVRLEAIEARLLSYLAARPGQVIPYQTLLEEVWGYQQRVSSRTVYATIHRLRPKVEVDASSPRHIVAVSGVGYRFDAPE